jgi:hypothetical protein
LADKSSQLILDALRRAATEPAGLPLVAARTSPGLFPPTATARPLAQRCKVDGLLQVVRTESHGKAPLEYCAITEKGLAHLLREVSPKQVLEDLVRALEARHAQVAEMLATARQWQSSLDGLKDVVERALHDLQHSHFSPGPSPNGAHGWQDEIPAALTRWRDAGASEDCPLPVLFRKVLQAYSPLTIGPFHDELRRLYEAGRIYLHPWTGPLYDMPEPAFALLAGHEIAYYACLRP